MRFRVGLVLFSVGGFCISHVLRLGSGQLLLTDAVSPDPCQLCEQRLHDQANIKPKALKSYNAIQF